MGYLKKLFINNSSLCQKSTEFETKRNFGPRPLFFGFITYIIPFARRPQGGRLLSPARAGVYAQENLTGIFKSQIDMEPGFMFRPSPDPSKAPADLSQLFLAKSCTSDHKSLLLRHPNPLLLGKLFVPLLSPYVKKQQVLELPATLDSHRINPIFYLA